MATKVVMEALSPTMEEGRLVEWKKQEGEPVAVGDVLAEVETDKAVMELVARVGGTLLKQTVPAGATVPVSAQVALIGEPGEAPSGNGATAAQPGAARRVGPKSAGEASAAAAPPAAAATEGGPLAEERADIQTAPGPMRERGAPAPKRGGARPAPPRPAPAAAHVRASPLARRIAQERGIDLRAVQGSGPEGRIVLRDLEEAASAAGPSPAIPLAPTPAGAPAAAAPAAPVAPAAPAGPPPHPAEPGAPYTDVPLTQIRKMIAKRLAQSLGPIPTFYLTTEVDMERVWEAREALLAGQQLKVSFNDIIIKAVATALRQHPECNAWWQDDHIRVWHAVHIGMAVAIEDGLITPVIRDADRKSLREIAAEAKELAARARERRLQPEEYTGSTFSISNLGMVDIDEFTAVINPPEAGILAVGRIQQRPVADGGTVALRRRMRLTMSCDHRVIDGARGAEFLRTLKGMLENPLALVF